MNKELQKELLDLLKKYHHYKYMSSGFWGTFKGWGHGMNLCDFMLWLESKIK